MRQVRIRNVDSLPRLERLKYWNNMRMPPRIYVAVAALLAKETAKHAHFVTGRRAVSTRAHSSIPAPHVLLGYYLHGAFFANELASERFLLYCGEQHRSERAVADDAIQGKTADCTADAITPRAGVIGMVVRQKMGRH